MDDQNKGEVKAEAETVRSQLGRLKEQAFADLRRAAKDVTEAEQQVGRRRRELSDAIRTLAEIGVPRDEIAEACGRSTSFVATVLVAKPAEEPPTSSGPQA